MASRRAALRLIGALPLMLAACGREKSAPVLAAGRPMPALVLPDLEGREIHAGGKGAAVINFWATWCPPCRAEMGGLDRLHRSFSGAGLAVYGVSVDKDLNLVREFILQQGINFPILWDMGGETGTRSLGIRAFPTTVLVRRDGIIADVVLGERNWDESPARDWAKALL